MARNCLDLSVLPWQFGRVSRQPFGPEPVDDRSEVTEWLPAKVPGDIRADLIAAGRIPPVETPAGIEAGVWVDDWDWWYRVQLPPNADSFNQAIVEADGIDYYSAIWLDEGFLAAQAGMFARRTVILPQQAGGPRTRELAIRIWGSGALPAPADSPLRRAVRRFATTLIPGIQYFPDRMATPKAQFSFGWDFAPRLLTAGIWDGIRLVTARGAYIEDLWVQIEPQTPEADPTPARWHFRVRVAKWQAGAIQAEIHLEPENFDDAGYQALHTEMALCPEASGPRTQDYDFVLDMALARRWWPWDQGESCLYRAIVRLRDDAGLMDEVTRVVGVRSVQRAQLPNGAPWRFLINGRPTFLRGANWVPVDVLPGRVAETDYTRLLAQARDAGINFLRVWGGGVREKEAFWHQCDRLGIMAWQEFPLACAFLDHYPRDREYLETLAGEARGIIHALRNHPSLIAWCGGNEINPKREQKPLGTIAGILPQEDPKRLWITASPSPGDVHQWNVWHGYAPWAALAATEAPFMSEFGLQALPDRMTIAEMFPDGAPPDLADRKWAARKAQANKLCHYAGLQAVDSLESAVSLTQRTQATALQVGLEACRRRRASCGGVAFWQFNEPWPVVSWSVIDRAGRPKKAYEVLKRSFQPVLVAADFEWRAYQSGDTFRAAIWLVNDSAQAWPDCEITAWLDGVAVWRADEIELAPASARPVGALVLELSTAPGRLELEMAAGPDILATNTYDLSIHLPGDQPVQARLMRWLSDRLLDVG